MSLIPLLKINHEKIDNILKNLINMTNIKDIDELIYKINDIPSGIINFSLKEWGVNESDIEQIILPNCFTPERMSNNVIPLSVDNVRNILNDIYINNL
mgnify:CR=1 FL=1|jgi:hypothetical protein|tara:strand:- start:300 stop:593 length:294 start_codon:yes stop_codon:yes gene_type:complete